MAKVTEYVYVVSVWILGLLLCVFFCMMVGLIGEGMDDYRDRQQQDFEAMCASYAPDIITLKDGRVLRGYDNSLRSKQGMVKIQDAPFMGRIIYSIPEDAIRSIEHVTPRP